jgi:hypothetical protein
MLVAVARAGLALSLTLWCSTLVLAQAPRPGTLRIVVRDATGLPISGAEVVVAEADGKAVAEARTGDNGISDVAGLVPGAYRLTIRSPGFEAATLTDLNVRSNSRLTREVTLKIAAFVEDIEVQPAVEDRTLAEAFTTQLSDDQLAALPEDPDELADVLAQLAGSDAEIRVDGFADGTLPPGTQIESVIIRYDVSASTSGGGPRVEIRTQPGGDRWRATMSARMRDEALNARNAFSDQRPSGQTKQYNWTVNGPVIKNRTGVSLSLERAITTDQQAVRAGLPDGALFSALVPRPSERLGGNARVEHAISPRQRLRVDIRQSNEDASNQGIGEFDLPERAFARTRQNGTLRVGHSATLRGQVTNDLRIVTSWQSSESTPGSTTTAIRVPGSLSFGGAQTQGGRASRTLEVENELRLTVHQRHQISSGMSVSGGHYHGDEWANAGGTFTFASLDDLAAGRPTSYTQRLGDPAFSYALYRFSAYVQDDIRVRKNLVVNAGVHQEWQTHLSDWQNVAPRLGVNWTPSAKWRTSLRAGFSVSYQSFQGNLYEQTLLVNGVRQSDLVIESPSYPDPLQGGLLTESLPPGIIRSDRGLVMPSTRRLTFGIDQPFGRIGRVRVNYSRQRGRRLFRSIDVNAPLDGVRPDPGVRNVTLLQSTGRSLNDSLSINASFNYPRYRLSANGTYTYGEQRNDSDGAFALPPDSGRLDLEWGPSRQDIRHRFDLSANSGIGFGFRFSTNVRLQTASPYTITTGADSNGDGVSNERPEGVGRNSARGSGTRNVDFTLTWGHGFGERATPPARTPRPGATPPRANPWVRMELYVQAQNALNLVNPQSYSGVLSSPFYGHPTSAAAPRRIALGFRFYY